MEQRTSTTEEYHRCVNIVIEYINNHLGEEIDLEKLAEISHFSPYHFHRIMKAFLHEPLGAFIVRTRIETAARLLRYSTMSVSDIAYQIGYGSPSSLSKIFKQFYGISPNEYRNNKDHVIMKPLEINPALDVTMEDTRTATETGNLCSIDRSVYGSGILRSMEEIICLRERRENRYPLYGIYLYLP